ncbi:MAG: DUF4384 domain-containing protein [Bryobacterales bacterium]|nr:DUF4384 domain-containing protein [Bryobacterales bacterium]
MLSILGRFQQVFVAGVACSLTLSAWQSNAGAGSGDDNDKDKGSGLSARQLFFTAKPGAGSGRMSAVPQTRKTANGPAAATPAPATPAPKGTSSTQTKSAGSATAQKPAATAPRLGLRYSILQNVNGKMQEVDVDKEFRSREHIGVSMRSNEDAFLYVVVQGSQGNWDVLYPYPGERNRVTAGQNVMIPPKCAAGQESECFAFDDDPGIEKLFIVLSEKPETDFDRLIHSVRGSAPAAGPNRPGTTALASASLPGSDIDRLRQQLSSRGIIRETVRRTSGGDENAMYVVASASTPRVVLDITLKHK